MNLDEFLEWVYWRDYDQRAIIRKVVEMCKEAENDIDVSGFAESILEAIELGMK